jgi:hypothetical protein
MMTLIVLLAAGALVVIAGEAVRVQCRRMVTRPAALAIRPQRVATEAVPAESAVAA